MTLYNIRKCRTDVFTEIAGLSLFSRLTLGSEFLSSRLIMMCENYILYNNLWGDENTFLQRWTCRCTHTHMHTVCVIRSANDSLMQCMCKDIVKVPLITWHRFLFF